MNSEEQTTDSGSFETPGARLNHVLDKFGFKEGHGRVAEFHQFLIKESPENFLDLKYTTVRSWFDDHSPVMRKINFIVDALQKEYQRDFNIRALKAWWKVGGQYPFIDGAINSNIPNEIDQNQIGKLQFQISSLVTEEAGKNFDNLSAVDLNRLKDLAVNLAIGYGDPFKTECPDIYLRLIIRGALTKLCNENLVSEDFELNIGGNNIHKT